MKRMETRRNELLTDIAKSIATTAQGLGIEAAIAEQIGAAATDALAQNWGGSVIVIPKDHFFKLSQRDRKILAEHKAGEPIGALAKRYKMTEMGMRLLLKRAEVRDRDHNQQQLFEEPREGARGSK